MRHADIAPCEEKIFYVFRIKAAIRYPVWRRSVMKKSGNPTVMVKSFRIMVIHAPSTVGDYIVEPSLLTHIVLGEDMIADVSAALAFARKEPQPFQHPAFRADTSSVFLEIPDT